MSFGYKPKPIPLWHKGKRIEQKHYPLEAKPLLEGEVMEKCPYCNYDYSADVLDAKAFYYESQEGLPKEQLRLKRCPDCFKWIDIGHDNKWLMKIKTLENQVSELVHQLESLNKTGFTNG